MQFINTFDRVFLILFITALVLCAVGFYKFVYFMSLGYGFAVAGLGGALLILYRDSLEIGTVLSCALLVVYGFRLSGFLLIRELKSSAYRNTMKKEIKSDSSVKFFVRIIIWVSCAFLYVCQIAPVLFRAKNESGTDPVCYIGIGVMLLGIIVESVADLQKSKAKKANPGRFCDRGLYKLVRCPNYLGEVVFWTGVLLSGVTVMNNLWQWIVSVFGYLCIVYIMLGGARRLELRQNRNYGADEEYQKYVKKTPILIPVLPIYSFAGQKWMVG